MTFDPEVAFKNLLVTHFPTSFIRSVGSLPVRLWTPGRAIALDALSWSFRDFQFSDSNLVIDTKKILVSRKSKDNITAV